MSTITRPINLPETTSPAYDDVIPVDRDTTGTRKVKLKTLVPALDVRWYGVVVGDATAAAANSDALALAKTAAAASGQALELPPGRIYIDEAFDVSALTEVRGHGTLGSPVQTEIVTTTAGQSAITNVSSGTKLSCFSIRPQYLRGVKSDTTSVAIQTASGQSDIVIEDVVITGFWRGIDASMWDSQIRGVTVFGAHRPLKIFGGATQNKIDRVTLRGEINAYPSNSDTKITISSYTAGSTSVTVSDGTAFSVGDIIRIDSSSVSNSISYKLWWRRVTAVSSNTLTISAAWPYSFTNGTVTIALGEGAYAIETNQENAFSATNIEWGRWTSLTMFTGPSIVGNSGTHVEGWCIYAPGSDVSAFDSSNVTATFSYIGLWNCTILDSTGVSLFGRTGGFQVQNIMLRDWDQFQATKTVYVAKGLTRSYPFDVFIGSIDNWGVPLTLTPSSITDSEQRHAQFHAGDDGGLIEPLGLGRRTFHGYSSTPTTGSFIAGDRVETSTGTLVCATSGSFATPAGTFKIRSGSRVLVVDNTARGAIGFRTPVTIGGAQYTVIRQTQATTPSPTTLSVDATAGDRQITLASASGLSYGEWLVLSFAGTFEDVQIQRINGNVVHLTLPLANSHASGSSAEVGYYLASASATDVTSPTSLAFTSPTFYSEAGAFTVSGASTFSSTVAMNSTVTMGAAALGNVLTITGNASGVRALKLIRNGVGSVGIGAGNATISFYDETGAAGLAALDGSSGSAVFFNFSAATTADANGKDGYINGNATSGENFKGGDVYIRSGAGTGNASRSNIRFRTPLTGSAGSTSQTYQEVARFDADTGTAGASALLIQYYNGSAWVEGRILVGASGTGPSGVGRMIYMA